MYFKDVRNPIFTVFFMLSGVINIFYTKIINIITLPIYLKLIIKKETIIEERNALLCY